MMRQYENSQQNLPMEASKNTLQDLLTEAITKNDVGTVKQYIQLFSIQGQNLNFTFEVKAPKGEVYKITPLIYSIQLHHWPIAESLIKTPDINLYALDSNKHSPLWHIFHELTSTGNIIGEHHSLKKIAKTLLKTALTSNNNKYPNIDDMFAFTNLQMTFKYTPLMIAAQYLDHELVLLLLKNGAEIDKRDAHEETALYHASQQFVDTILCTKSSVIRETLFDNFTKTASYLVEYGAKESLYDTLSDTGDLRLFELAAMQMDDRLLTNLIAKKINPTLGIKADHQSTLFQFIDLLFDSIVSKDDNFPKHKLLKNQRLSHFIDKYLTSITNIDDQAHKLLENYLCLLNHMKSYIVAGIIYNGFCLEDQVIDSAIKNSQTRLAILAKKLENMGPKIANLKTNFEEMVLQSFYDLLYTNSIPMEGSAITMKKEDFQGMITEFFKQVKLYINYFPSLSFLKEGINQLSSESLEGNIHNLNKCDNILRSYIDSNTTSKTPGSILIEVLSNSNLLDKIPHSVKAELPKVLLPDPKLQQTLFNTILESQYHINEKHVQFSDNISYYEGDGGFMEIEGEDAACQQAILASIQDNGLLFNITQSMENTHLSGLLGKEEIE